MASANLFSSNTKYLTLTIAIVIFIHILNVRFSDANNNTLKGIAAIDGKSKGTQISIKYFPLLIEYIKRITKNAPYYYHCHQ